MKTHSNSKRSKTFFRALPLALAVALLATAGTAWAQPPGGGLGPPGAGFGPRMDGPGHGPLGPMALLGPLAERLDLSDEQRETIRGILESQRQANRPWHEDLQSLGAELENTIEAEPFDEEAVRAVARQLADVRVELAVAHARTAQEVRAVLTPDQRETLGELRAQRRERGPGFGGPGRRGPRHHGPGR